MKYDQIYALQSRFSFLAKSGDTQFILRPKEIQMKIFSLFKVAAGASVVAVLAACGGGDDSPAVSWASPAAFVSPGASNTSFALSSCQRDVRNEENDESLETDTLYKASLLIASNGDVSLLASFTADGSPTVLWSLPFDQVGESAWTASGTTQTPSYSLQLMRSSPDVIKSLAVYQGDGQYLRIYDEDKTEQISISFDCDMADSLSLQIRPDSSRFAANFGTPAGVTTFDGTRAEGRIEAGSAFWSSIFGSAQYSNLRFNLSTGELASSTSTTGTYSLIGLDLPSANGTSGSYGETFIRNSQQLNGNDEKSICVIYTSDEDGYFSIEAQASGSQFAPNGGRSVMQPQGDVLPRKIARDCEKRT